MLSPSFSVHGANSLVSQNVIANLIIISLCRGYEIFICVIFTFEVIYLMLPTWDDVSHRLFEMKIKKKTDSERLKERKIDMKRYFRARWTLRTDICQCAVYASIWFCVRRFFFHSPVNLIKKFFEADIRDLCRRFFLLRLIPFLADIHRRIQSHYKSNSAKQA